MPLVIVFGFQSTHPCGVRRMARYISHHSSLVSIHAPLRGATAFGWARHPGDNRFNPRTPAGCDLQRDQVLVLRRVSIHAPLRGATMARRRWTPRSPVSIHAPLRGATSAQPSLSGDSMSFQSTHPCGVRQQLAAALCVGRGFQSTHPCGVRLDRTPVHSAARRVSIHAPLRGATLPGLWVKRRANVSIHAPLRGATGGQRRSTESTRSFNPRTPAGCDPTLGGGGGFRISVSIHAPLRGATVPL